jgi:hypothetical protein
MQVASEEDERGGDAKRRGAESRVFLQKERELLD